MTCGEAKTPMNQERSRFRRGQRALWRSVSELGPGYVIPATVVTDDDQTIALFQHHGVVCKRRTGQRGGPRGRNLLPGSWDGSHADRTWKGKSNLHLYRPGTNICVIRDWDPMVGYHGWYANIEADWVRTPIGFDSRDLIIDVVPNDDLSGWKIKDRDEFDWAAEHGVLTPREIETALAAVERATAAIERRAWPFGEDWSKWAPDPGWPVPVLPDNWSQLWDG